MASKKFPFTISCIYLLVGSFLLPLYSHQINPDGISYITIARQYLQGNYADAVSGHWGPLFSWLLIPFIGCGINSLFAVKLLNLIIGTFTVTGLYILSFRFRMTQALRICILITAIPVLVYFAFYLITPDLLLSCLLLLYFNYIFHENYSNHVRYGVYCGILGGLAYLAKSYALPFFICHFLAMNILQYLYSSDTKRKHTIVLNALIGFALFSAISASWINLLSIKYGEFTTTTQTAHNFLLVQPDPPPTFGLVAPPYENATSVWVEPYSRIAKDRWSPFQSTDDFIHWMNYFKGNIYPTLLIFITFSPVIFFLCISYVLWSIARPKKLLHEKEIIYSFITGVPYTAGYCLVLVDERYLWVLCLLLMILGGYIVSNLFNHSVITKKIRLFCLAVFFVSFSVHPVQKLITSAHSGKCIWKTSRKLQEHIPQHSKLASNSHFFSTMYMAYHLDVQYYGTTENLAIEEQKQELKKYAISYFLLWDPKNAQNLSHDNFQKIASGTYNNTPFIVYKIKHTKS